MGYASHIVGGSLTYVYNGGTSYTILLKLYRDCTGIALPNNVTILVLGYNGETFSPSRDISIPVGTITPVPDGLPACAAKPTPLPCVQEGVYTKTVNLPNNPGGYHLYYQNQARNTSITNVTGVGCNCIGETFYAHIPSQMDVWGEDFDLADNTTSDNGVTAWTTTPGSPAAYSAKVNSGQFEIKGAFQGQQTWTSQVIDISKSTTGVSLKANLSESGTLDANDSLQIYYKLNGGPLTLFSSNGFKTGDFTSAIASNGNIIGNTLQIVVKARFDNSSPSSETFKVDNVLVYETNNRNNSSPVFNQFPPLFICKGQQLVFDHSASDPDGDSLVYDLYNPYNGDNPDLFFSDGNQPTFSNNIASFPEIVFKSGYTTNAPLGGDPIDLNSSTGLLKVTPPNLGQYVVGVRVKEYRNGVFLDATLRDFQFNIVTCADPLAVSIINPDPVICYGATSTTITANPTGGKTPYTYLWNNTNPAKTINVGVGTYQVKVTDAQNCAPVYATVNVISYTVPVTSNGGSDQTVCNQNPTTTLSGSVSGASTGIWSGGAGTFSPSNTALNAQYTPTAGEISTGYVDLTLTTTGSALCPSGSDVMRINYVGFQGTVSASKTDVSCYGGSNGTSTVSITGGATPHTYFWTTSQTTASITGLLPNTYSVTITDALGCTTNTSTTVTQPAILALSSTVTAVSCGGTATGAIGVTPSGGTAPYTYFWKPGNQTTSSITSQLAGTYTVTVTDFNGCTATAINTITEPTPLVLSLDSTNVSCNGGANGSITSTVTGGQTNYSYAWSSGQTSPNLSSIAAGVYTLTVTDANGCKDAKSVTITQPTLLTATTSFTNISCNGLTDGTATAIPSGGTTPYTYNWLPGAKTTATATALAAGTYTVTVTDALGCTVKAVATIAEPSVLAVSFVSQSNVSCFSGSNGAVTANASGGTAAYSYVWSPGGSTTAARSGLSSGTFSVTVTDSRGCTANNNITITQPTQLTVSVSKTDETCNQLNNGSATASVSGGTSAYSYLWQPGALTASSVSNLSAGSYSLTVTDAQGCTTNTITAVSEPAVLVVSFTGQSNVSCNAGSDGAATASPTGGTTPYTYSWSPGGSNNAILSGMSAGTYTATVTDSKGCVASNTVTITEPNALSVSTTVTNESCDYSNNGSIVATALGGTATYSYLWLPGNLTTGTISSLAAGTYSVTVTDSKGCTASNVSSVTEPATLAIAFTGQINVSCFGGSDGAVSSNITGGTANYTYSWLPGNTTSTGITNVTAGTYTLNITDSKSCVATNNVTITQPAAPLTATATVTNASCNAFGNGAITINAAGGTTPYSYNWLPGNVTTQNLSNIAAGTYSLTITDAKGCLNSLSKTLTEPAAIGLTINTTNADCGNPNGQASVVVSGGTTPYSYLWTPSVQTTSTATGLLAGTYSLVVTDNAGCIVSQQVNVNENLAPTVSILLVKNVSCYGGNDGSVTIGLTGGIAPFTYSWSPYGGTDSIATGLTAGFYTANVTAANGCKASVTTSPAVTQPTAIDVNVSTTPVSCFGGSDGSATVSASGGTPGYTYQWLPSLSTGNSIGNLSAVSYTVEVTDANSCVMPKAFSVSEPSAPLAVSVSFDSVSCFGGSDGVAYAVASGGTANYIYTWTPGNIVGQNASNLAIGTYTVTVEDAKLCVTTNTVTVQEPPVLTLSSGGASAYCSLPNGQLSVTANGGSGGYSYLWLPTGGNAATATGLSAGSYTVQVTDDNSCIAKDVLNLIDMPGPIASVVSTSDVTCHGGNDGTAVATFSSGTGPFNFIWSPVGGTNTSASNLTTGTYTFTVTDANGCASSTPAMLVNEPSNIAIVVTPTMVSCNGLIDGSASVSVSGGTPGYTYVWLPGGQTTTSISNLPAGTYSVQVTDAANCVQVKEYTITQPNVLTVSMSPIKNVSCYQGNDGEATASVNGGTPVYNYQWLPSGGNGSMATGLIANTYTVVVTDKNGCVASAIDAVTQPALPLTATATGGATSCFGGNDGTASVSPAGGTAGYSYLWSPGGNTNQNPNTLSAQQYFVLVTDNNGCQFTTTAIVTEPTKVTGNLVKINPSCGLPNGSISSQVSGGIPPYTYLWDFASSTTTSITSAPPGNYNVQIRDAQNCLLTLTETLVNIPGANVSTSSIDSVSCYGGNDGSATISISAGTLPYSINWLPYGGSVVTASGLTAGSYTVNVTDGLGCVTPFVLAVPEPQDLSIGIAVINDVRCYGENTGSVIVSPNGGTPSYRYSWQPYGGTTATASNLIAGTYSVTVLDYHGCSETIAMPVSQPDTLLSSIINPVNPLCFGLKGSATALASGGTIPYAYSWSTSPALTNNIEALFAGAYTVTVTDANACIATSTVTLTQPNEVQTSAGANDTVCFGQMATLTASATGGAGMFRYAWYPSNGSNQTSTFTLFPTSDSLHIVVAYDKNGCPGTPDTTHAVGYFLGAGSINAQAITPICPGRSTVISVSALVSAGPLTYQWDNGLGTGAGDFVVTPTQPTTYAVTAISAVCGSTTTDSVSVTFSPNPTIIATPDTSAVCVPGTVQFSDQSVTGNISDPINSWLWTFGDGQTSVAQNPRHEFKQEGTYYVNLSVTTLGGCTSTNTVTPLIVNAHAYPTAGFSVNKTELTIPVDKLITTNTSVGANQYYWNFGDGTTSKEAKPVHNYKSVGQFNIELIATSPYGCSDTANKDVLTDIAFVFPNVFTPDPNGSNGGIYGKTSTSNDVFFPFVEGVVKFKMQVFNRWGELIFESTDLEVGWDGYYRGQMCQQDVYVWKAYMKLNNGKEYEANGDITLLR